MVEFYSFNRAGALPYNTLYIVFQKTHCFGQEQFHCIEHMLMREVINHYPFLAFKLKAVTTNDYIKFQCFEKEFDLRCLVDFVTSKKWLTSQGFQLALSEIKQEKALLNQTSTELLTVIRVRKEEIILNYSDFYQTFNELNSELKYLLCGEGIVQSSNFRKDFLKNTVAEKTIGVKKGSVNYNGAEFLYHYMTIPIAALPDLSSIYFLQDFANTTNQKLRQFRYMGIYYSFCFCKYYKDYIELFVVISKNHLIADFDNQMACKLSKLYESYAYVPRKVESETVAGIQGFKEDLVALYLSDEFGKSNEPLYNQAQKSFIKTIIHLLGGNCDK